MTRDRPAGDARAPRVPRRRDRPAAPSRPTVLGAAVALVGVWLVAALFRIAHPPPGPVDRWWDALMGSSNGPVAHGLAEALAVAGTGLPATALVGVVAVLLGAARGWARGLFLVAASSVGAAEVAGLKALAHRARPDAAYGLFNAFPSGHTAFAALLGGVVILLVPQALARAAAVAWILAMAWSRTQLHAHWLTDVVAGGVVGAATAVLLLAAAAALATGAGRRRTATTGTAGATWRGPRRG